MATVKREKTFYDDVIDNDDDIEIEIEIKREEGVIFGRDEQGRRGGERTGFVAVNEEMCGLSVKASEEKMVLKEKKKRTLRAVVLSDDIWFTIIAFVGTLIPIERLLPHRADLRSTIATLRVRAIENAVEISACFSGEVDYAPSDSTRDQIHTSCAIDGYVLLAALINPHPKSINATDYSTCLSLIFRKHVIPSYIPPPSILETFLFRIRKELEDEVRNCEERSDATTST
ncbi:hypothetical protein TL16_g04295 [Triparma laevis f. inornata]|uniref:Uncharacterized protein n=1 Tax=Triparma laevis f. inornata TaxID=1714386 RepID=A0A9W7ADN7_9STRA|nr:hypothetical protein TL16_g04295 [Triparma laevis f. inornata]